MTQLVLHMQGMASTLMTFFVPLIMTTMICKAIMHRKRHEGSPSPRRDEYAERDERRREAERQKALRKEKEDSEEQGKARERESAEKVWAEGKRIYDEVKAAYADFLFTPQRWVEQPALNDHLTCQETMAFLDAFNDAGALDTETAPDSVRFAERFEKAAKAARAAWRKADSASRRNGTPVADASLKSKLDRAQSALALAFDATASEGERRAAMQAVRRLMEDVVPASVVVRVESELTSRNRMLALPSGKRAASEGFVA